MKKITEAIVRKDASIHKVQFDREWFYSLEDMEYFLKEDLSGVEAVSLPMEIFGETMNVKCATWEDIERYRYREPLQDFKGSVFRNKKNLEKGN
jgi:hypothetical protein